MLIQLSDILPIYAVLVVQIMDKIPKSETLLYSVARDAVIWTKFCNVHIGWTIPFHWKDEIVRSC
jgi:hypothetical protein